MIDHGNNRLPPGDRFRSVARGSRRREHGTLSRLLSLSSSGYPGSHGLDFRAPLTVSVIVHATRCEDALVRCLESLRALSPAPEEILVVVNTDADQVIVAFSGTHTPGKMPPIRYLSGGLENADMRKHVCDILEGGARAFKERARRLRVRLDR